MKRSVSMPDHVAAAIDEAARHDGVSFSTWLAAAAEHQLVLRSGNEGVGSFEDAAGTLTPEERAANDAVLRRILSGMGVRSPRSRRR